MARLEYAATASEREEIERRLEVWKEEHEKEKKYISKTSLDLVIATSDPIPSPLLAIEVDGHSHNDPCQQEKDAMKNTFCEQAGLPLIRITYDHFPQQQEQSHQAKYARRIRVEFIRFIIRRLVALMDTENQLWREHFEAIEAYQSLPEFERMRAESEDWCDRFSILNSSEEYNSQDLYYKMQELGCLAGG
jgi:very-short-patch-repair endonuclease